MEWEVIYIHINKLTLKHSNKYESAPFFEKSMKRKVQSRTVVRCAQQHFSPYSLYFKVLCFHLRLGVIQIRHSGAVPFGTLFFLLDSRCTAASSSSVSSVASSVPSLVEHFHGYLVVRVLAFGVPPEGVALGKARVA